MNRVTVIALLLIGALGLNSGCDSKKGPVSSGREAVKDAVTQPFKPLDEAKDSLKKGDDKSKTAIENLDKDSR